MALNGPALLSRVRKYIDDSVVPYNTDDATLYNFLTEAERELALTGRLLRMVMSFRLTEGSPWFFLPETPELIEFRKAELIDGTNRRAMRLQGTMDTYSTSRVDYGVVISGSTSTTGRPNTIIMGLDTDRGRVSPTPDQDYTIEAAVLVYPEEPISATTEQVAIPIRHEASVPIGAAVRAIEADPFFDDNSNKLQSLSSAWQQALVRAARETGAITREASPVQFSNDYW